MKRNKKTVAFLAFSLAGGGAERNILNLIPELERKNINVHLILIKNKIDYKDQYPIDRYNITCLTPDNVPRLLSMLIFPFALIRLLYLIQKLKITIIIAATEYIPLYIAYLINILLRIPYIAIVGTNLPFELAISKPIKQTINSTLSRISLRSSRHSICVSEGLRESLIATFGLKQNNITHVYNGVCPTDHKHAPKTNTIVAMGRLEYQKGYRSMLNIFKSFLIRNRQYHLYILGDGSMKHDLIEYARNLGIGKNVHFEGFVSPYSYLANAMLHISTSFYEGLNNSIIEALSLGIPVISTDCNFGPREILATSSERILLNNHEIMYASYGILSPSLSTRPNTPNKLTKNEKLFVSGMEKIVSDTKLYNKYKISGPHRAKQFSMTRMINSYFRVIHSVLNDDLQE